MKILKIEEEKVLKAAESCPQAKNVLEILFPDTFKILGMDQILKQESLNTLKGRPVQFEKIGKREYIKIPLPCSNTELTFEAFDMTKKIIELLPKYGYSGFPEHSHEFEGNDFIYIYYYVEGHYEN